MGELRRIAVELDEDSASLLDSLVQAGRFANANDAIGHAMRLLVEEDRRAGDVRDETLRTHGIERLRAMIDEGLASEPVEGGFDAEEIKRNGRIGLAARLA